MAPIPFKEIMMIRLTAKMPRINIFFKGIGAQGEKPFIAMCVI